MPLIVEDGTGVAGANSFVTREQIIEYAKDRGVVLSDDETTDTKSFRAMDYINSQCFAGDTVFVNQVMPFPRKGLIEGDDVTGYPHSIPYGVVRAQLQLVVDIANGIDVAPSRAASPQLKRRKTGPIEREYFEQTEQLAWLPIVAGALKPLLCGQGQFSIRTYRA